MATIRRGSSKTGTDTGTASSDAPVVDSVVDGPVIETDPGDAKQGDEVIGTGDPEQGDEVIGTGDAEKKALAASEMDLAKLQAARRARVIKAAVLTTIGLILIVFVLQNAQPVDVRLVAWTVPIRLIWVIVASVLLGAIAGYLVGRPEKQLRLHGPNRRKKDPL